MINLKNLKSLFILDEEEITPKKEPEKKEKPKKENSRSVPLKPKNKQSTPPPLPTSEEKKQSKKIKTPTSSKPSINKRHYDKLIKAIQDSNLEGFDYLEFKNSLKALDALPLDEATKYRSAFATATTMGLTFENLVKTATYYKTIIDKEKDKFRAAFKQQGTDKILSKDQEKQKLAQIISHKQKQIAALQAQIEQHNKELCDIEDYINDISHKIETTKNNFIATYEHLQGKLNTDLEKIHRYLK